MKILHNCISNKELRVRMFNENEQRITISFYKYFIVDKPHEMRDSLYTSFSTLKVFGRIYLANEGINAQISIPKKNIKNLRILLNNFDPSLKNIRFNFAIDNDRKSFWVLRMKVRKKIVSDGINVSNFDPNNVGKYLKAEKVNAIIDDPDVMLVDIRNQYEYEVGHFENAIKIPANTFREQLPKVVEMMQEFKDKKIVMYCTGGIRCEKASAWMKYNGFNNIWHIEGGIIEYVRYVRERGLPLRFIGKNFVFDERMGERISDDVIAHCYQCRKICDIHTNCKYNRCHALFIQCLSCAEKFKGCCSEFCRNKYEL